MATDAAAALQESMKAPEIEITVPKEYTKSTNNEFCSSTLNLALRLHAFTPKIINGFAYASTKLALNER